MIYFRTDANEKIATGHVMRCMTIAFQLQKMGEKIKFLFRDQSSVEVLDAKLDYEMICPKDCNLLGEVENIKKILREDENPVLVFDSYQFNAEYMQNFNGIAKLITFDDMFVEKFPVDILINYNLYYTIFDYDKRYNTQHTRLLLGGKYVPLRKEFQKDFDDVPNKNVNKILVICGGGDRYHMILSLIKDFCEHRLYQKFEIIAVAGIFNPDIDKLYQYGQKFSNIKVYENVHNLADIMNTTDIIVSAASTVLYECCCVGVPTIFFSVAENQDNDVKAFAADQTMYFAGNVRTQKEQVINNIFHKIQELSRDYAMRCKMINRMKQKIDGKGAERIAEVILSIEKNEI